MRGSYVQLYQNGWPVVFHIYSFSRHNRVQKSPTGSVLTAKYRRGDSCYHPKRMRTLCITIAKQSFHFEMPKANNRRALGGLVSLMDAGLGGLEKGVQCLLSLHLCICSSSVQSLIHSKRKWRQLHWIPLPAKNNRSHSLQHEQSSLFTSDVQ